MENLTKIAVARGIYWVEAPEAGLRILCGCPGDSVKHLIKRGLILEKEKNGVRFETGPNAILLSDTMLQNGEFANLGEFPVLQMLYKQGLIIPNHPNNTGEKPLLIGLAEQVNAQMQYIYRGNYGLVSKEELVKTGASETEAEAMMRLKLRFAFGAIQPTRALLDACYVGDDPAEIKNGVTIRRKEHNIFEIAYRGENVEVDLNLKPTETYPSAYPLGFQQIKRAYFGVIHSGEGDGWDINRPSMSSILMFQGKIYLIDAGPNLANNLTSLGIGLNEIEGLFHTHAHDDHFAGITTLMRAGKKIKYFAARMVRASVEKKIAALLTIEEERFADFFEIHDLELDAWNDISGLEVKPVFSPHPLETTIFQFRTLCATGYKSYAHFADIVALETLEGMVTQSTDAPGVSRRFFNQVKEAYLTPADLKKLDVGGGMIHGAAADFRQDASGKILLAHTSLELTPEEKEIGSNAPYGITDILIDGQTEIARRNAFDFLHSYFPEAPKHQILILLNNDILDFNPGTIMLKEGRTTGDILLLLSGVVEQIRAQDDMLHNLSAGALVGELAGLHQLESEATFRAASFVRALRLPVKLYMEVVERNGLWPRFEQSWDRRAFLENTRLFGEGVPLTSLKRILETMEELNYAKGSTISCRDLSFLHLVKSGRMRRSVGEDLLDELGPRDFFGEEGAVFNSPCLYRVEILEPTTVYRIPGELAGEIPIVRWKLFETYLKRTLRIVHTCEAKEAFAWREEFSVGIATMDTHHKKLVEIANGIMEIIRSDGDAESMARAMETLVDYTRYHFSEEEAVLAEYGYVEIDEHKARHAVLVEQVLDFQEKVNRMNSYDGVDFRGFFTNWLINHILSEDKRYGAYLNGKCIF